METLCRICLKDSHRYLCIFEDEIFKDSLSFEDVNYVYNLEIRMDDDFPRFICIECEAKVREFIEWKIKAHRAQLKLIQMRREIESIFKDQDLEDFESLTDDEGTPKLNDESEIHTEGGKVSPVPEVVEMGTKVMENGNVGRNDTAGIDARISSSLPATQGYNVGVEKRKYFCEICKKVFVSRNGYRIHSMTHTGERPYKCNMCERTFIRKDVMVNHQLVHKPVKPYECEHCGKKMRSSATLRNHYRAHFAIRRDFQCEECGKTFCSKASLKAHQLIHKNEKPFMCHECGRCFRQSMSLEDHLRSHFVDRQLACYFCGDRFCRKPALRAHLEKVHGEETTYRPRKRLKEEVVLE